MREVFVNDNCTWSRLFIKILNMYNEVCPDDGIPQRWKRSTEKVSMNIIAPAVRVDGGQTVQGESAFDFLLSEIVHSLYNRPSAQTMGAPIQRPMASPVNSSMPALFLDQRPAETHPMSVHQKVEFAKNASNFEPNMDMFTSRIGQLDDD
jgi:hypothetical protein